MVTVILADFRGLDTMVEITVLVVAILGVFEPEIKDAITNAIDSVSNSK